jgi:predicted nicotinamide N-methyase
MEFSRFSLHFCLCFLLACLGPIAVSSFLGPSVRQETFLGRRSFLLKTSNIADISSLEGRHVVNDIICREIPMDLPTVGRITILEATAESQEELVDMALLLEEEVVQQQNQKLREGDPYGAVLWPAAWAVANYLLTNSTIDLSSCTLLELGTGTGLVSMAAALGGATVIATDYETLALELTDYAARTFHNLEISCQILDMCDYETPLPPADLVVAADIMYEPKTGIAMAHRTVEALKRGSRVIVGDSPGRPGRPAFLAKLKELGVVGAEFHETVGRTCSGPRHELICGKGSTSVSATPQDLSVALMDLNPSMIGEVEHS